MNYLDFAGSLYQGGARDTQRDKGYITTGRFMARLQPYFQAGARKTPFACLWPARGVAPLIDRSVYFIGLSSPAMTIPQLLTIWLEENVSGVSAVTWVAYLVGSLFWLGYGILHRQKPIIFTHSIWIAMEVMILAGLIFNG